MNLSDPGSDYGGAPQSTVYPRGYRTRSRTREQRERETQLREEAKAQYRPRQYVHQDPDAPSPSNQNMASAATQQDDVGSDQQAPGSRQSRRDRQSSQADDDQTQQRSRVSPVNNERVQKLLSERAGPQREGQFDAFDSRRASRNNTQPPQEQLTRDDRGDWVPKARYSDRSGSTRPKQSSRRPFADTLPSEAEPADLNTSHGRYLNKLLGRLEQRERTSTRRTQSALAFVSDGSGSEEKSFSKHHSGGPDNYNKGVQGAPTRPTDTDNPPWGIEVEHDQ